MTKEILLLLTIVIYISFMVETIVRLLTTVEIKNVTNILTLTWVIGFVYLIIERI